MVAVRYILLLITIFMVGFQAKAENLQGPELGDILSPDELIEEFGIDSQTLYKNMFWNSSFENPRLRIIINKANKGTAQDAQTLEAWVDGVLAYRFLVSTGKEVPIKTTSGKMSSRRTSVGTFRIHTRSINHVSKTWVGASMPFAQFFNGGIAIHATVPAHFNEIGQRDSGGCVRLMPVHAKEMWRLVSEITVAETIITVYDGTQTSHPLGTPGMKPAFDIPISKKKKAEPVIVTPTPAPVAPPTVVPPTVTPAPTPQQTTPYPAWGGKTPAEREEAAEDAEEQAEREREATEDANKAELRRIQKMQKNLRNSY